MTEALDEPTSPPRRRRNWRTIILAAVVVTALGALAAWSIADDRDKDRRRAEIDSARARVATAALDKLNRSVHGAIAHPGQIRGKDWEDGRIKVVLTIGTCHNVSGYVETPPQPDDKSWGIVHILVPGKNAETPPADIWVINDSDLFALKRTLNDTDSGLRHCAVGDWRLFPVDG